HRHRDEFWRLPDQQRHRRQDLRARDAMTRRVRWVALTLTGGLLAAAAHAQPATPDTANVSPVPVAPDTISTPATIAPVDSSAAPADTALGGFLRGLADSTNA